MTRWILDTDHASSLLKGDTNVAKRVAIHYPKVAITIITVQELYGGWASRTNRNKDSADAVRLYRKLAKTVEFVKSIRVLDFDEAASNQYNRLIQQDRKLSYKRIERDIRIASIALSLDAVVITRNKRDFERVPRLKIENWIDNAP